MNVCETLAIGLTTPGLLCGASAGVGGCKVDTEDQQIGVVAYVMPFNRHFYQYQPPRDLVKIDADLDAVSADIMNLLQEVHS